MRMRLWDVFTNNSLAQDTGFEQRFCFAVKLMRELYDMSGALPKTM